MRASAPGKLLLLGEYGVLEGGLALVGAVDRRAMGRRVPSQGSPLGSAVVEAVRARVRAAGLCADLEGDAYEIDTHGFQDAGGRKLGIGSSAAVAVVTAALALGRDGPEVLELALAGHRDAMGSLGSGVDVAASVRGGVIATRRQPAPVEILESVADLAIHVLFTGASAATEDFVRALRATAGFRARAQALAAIAESGVAAYRGRDVAGFLEAVRAYGSAMEELGAGVVPVVTEAMGAVMRAAKQAGGAAKPSGAGGGDVVLIFGLDGPEAHAIANAAGCSVIEGITVGVEPGLRVAAEVLDSASSASP